MFLNNGPIASERLAVMEAAGTVDARGDLELHESYWAALRLVEERPWSSDDLVYFGEDDYLYRRDALASLVEAARVLPDAAYLAPYATVGREMPNGEPLHPGLRRPRERPGPAWRIGAYEWRPATSHTSSFAVRAGALRADLRLHRTAPRCSGAWTTRWRSRSRPRAVRAAGAGLGARGPRRCAADPAGEGHRLAGLAHRSGARPMALWSSARRPAPRSRRVWETAVMAVGTDWAAEHEAALHWAAR